MTSLQAYESFLTKLNKGDSNANINVPRGKFVMLFNEHAKTWLKQNLKTKISTNQIDELNYLLVDNIPLTRVGSHLDHVDYELPTDFFDLSNSISIAERDECSRVLENWYEKDKNIRVLLKDSNYKPSFDYEETLCTLANNKIKVYFDDFDIQSVYLTYYKQPQDIDIEGYIKLDNQLSVNIDPDLPDFAVNEIVNRCALDFQGISENRDGFQIAQERVTKE